MSSDQCGDGPDRGNDRQDGGSDQKPSMDKPYGGSMNRDIPISFERRGNEIVVRIGEGDTTAETRMPLSDARLAIPRLIDELGDWGRFDAP